MTRTCVTVRDKLTGEVVAKGTQTEVAEQLHVTQPLVCMWIKQGCKQYDITVGREEIDLEAAAAWDRFCEPIRKKYGIEVKKCK